MISIIKPGDKVILCLTAENYKPKKRKVYKHIIREQLGVVVSIGIKTATVKFQTPTGKIVLKKCLYSTLKKCESDTAPVTAYKDFSYKINLT